MASVVTYKPGAFCQLKLDSGERILISCAQTGIKIMKLGWGGLFPTGTLADWPLRQLDEAIAIFADTNSPAAHPLDAIVSKLKSCSSIVEVRNLCSAGS
jgi:hypothetical protein